MVFLTVVDLIQVGQHYDLKPADWGTWVGSIGTVGALLGTLWITTAQSRKEMLQARLHAAGFMLRLVATRSAVRKVCESLSIDERKDRGEAKITACIFDLDQIVIWTAADLVAMAPLSSRKIGRLAVAGDEIALAISALEMVRSGDDSLDTPKQRMEFAGKLGHILSNTVEHIDEGIEVCDRARRSLRVHST